MTRRAILVGATGLVGKRVLAALLEDPAWGAVWALVRRPLEVRHPKLTVRVVDFDRLGEVRFPHVDDVFCSVGTTIRAAGSQAAFRRVDFDYPLGVARAALARDARQFLFVSAMGANSGSPVFYNRVKGELEQAIGKLRYRSAFAFRPSFLAGDRPESRPGERFALAVLQPLRFLVPRKYQPVSDLAVAHAMLAYAKRGLTGFHVIESDAIQALAAP